MKKLGRIFERNLQRIATVFCAVSVGIFSTLCPLLIAALADASGVVDYVDYAFDSWANVPDDLKALGEAYVKFYKSTTNGADIGGAIDSIADIPKSWVKLIGDSQFILSPVMGVRYFLDNGTLKYSKKAADTGQSISDTCVTLLLTAVFLKRLTS